MTFWDMFQTNENSLYARIAGAPMDPKGHIASRAAHPVQTPGLIGIVGDGDDNTTNCSRARPMCVCAKRPRLRRSPRSRTSTRKTTERFAFHGQMIADFLTVEEIGYKMLDELGKKEAS
jgi:hypothetical protein